MGSKIVDLRGSLALFILVLLVGSAMMAQTTKQPWPGTGSMGRVTGTVMDTGGAVIVVPKPSIIFQGRNSFKRVTANDNGDYEISLPAGVYKVSTEIPGFYPVRRSAFRVLSGSTLMINLLPTPHYQTRGTTVSTKESLDKPMPRPKYDEFHIPASSPSPMSLVIQFEKKRIVDGTVKYNGAILSYDELTIFTEELCFNMKNLRLKASGNPVTVEDGKERVQVKQAMVSFKGAEPVVDLTR